MVVLSSQPPRISAAGPATGELVLRIIGTEREGQVVRLSAAKCTVGAAAGCTLRLRARGVRPLHCVIVRGARGTVIRSWSQPTRLNGASFSDAPLVVGDRLTIGPIELEVMDAAEPVEVPPELATSAPVEAASPVDPLAEPRAELERQRQALDNERHAWQTACDARDADAVLARQSAESLAAELRQVQSALQQQHDSFERQRAESLAEIERGTAEVRDARAAFLAEQQRAAADLIAEREQIEQQRAELDRAAEERREADQRRELERQQNEQDRQAQQQQALPAAVAADQSEELTAREARLAFAEQALALASDEWESRRQDQAAELAASSHRLQVQRGQAAAQAAELADQQTELDAQVAQLASQRAELAGVSEELATTRVELAVRQAQLGRERAEFDSQVHARQAAALGHDQQLQEQADALAEQSASLAQQQAELTQQREQLESRRTDHETQRAAQEAKLAERAQKIEALASQLEQQRAAASEGLRSQQEQQQLLVDATARAADFERREQEMDRREQEIQGREHALIERESVSAELSANTTVPHAADLDEREAQLQVQQRELEDQRAALQAERDEALAELESDRQRIERRREQVLSEQAELADQRAEFEAQKLAWQQREAEDQPQAAAREEVVEHEPERDEVEAYEAEVEEAEETVAPAQAAWSRPVAEEPEPTPSCATAPASPKAHGEEQSIEEYMAALLHRMRGGKEAPQGAAPSPERPTPPPTRPQPTAEPVATLDVEVSHPEPAPAAPAPQPIEWVPRPQSIEPTDLAAMRELANTQARIAIDVHGRKRLLHTTLANIGISLICLMVTFVVLNIIEHDDHILRNAAMGGVVGGIYWVYAASKSAQQLIVAHRMKTSGLRARIAKAKNDAEAKKASKD